MSSSMVLGILITVAGISMLLQAVFGIHIPLFRSALGVMLLYWGARLILGGWSPSTTGHSAVMEERTYKPGAGATGNLRYDVFFGSALVDLTGLRPKEDVDVEVNAIFGSAQVRFDPSVPVDVEANSAFGEVRLPDENTVAFGQLRYPGVPAPRRGDAPRIHMRLNAVFGSVHLVERHASSNVSQRALESRAVAGGS